MRSSWARSMSHGRLVFFFGAKKKTRQLEGKAGTNRWSGRSSTADNETCATFRKHSRRQEHDNVCSKISKMCGKKKGAGKRFPKPHGGISDGAREKSRASARSQKAGHVLEIATIWDSFFVRHSKSGRLDKEAFAKRNVKVFTARC